MTPAQLGVPRQRPSTHQGNHNPADVASGVDQHGLHMREADFLGSRASVADFRPSNARPQPISPMQDYGRLRRNSDSLSIDSNTLFGRPEYENAVSPFSSLAELTYLTSSRKFVASMKYFYFIHQSVLNPSLSPFRQRQQREEHSRRTQQTGGEDRQHPKKRQDNSCHIEQVKSRLVSSEPYGNSSAPTASNTTREPDSTVSPSAAATTGETRGNFFVNHQEADKKTNGEDEEWGCHQKNALENLALVEQCISHKISPDYIAAIIMGRKKTDKLAKQFCKA